MSSHGHDEQPRRCVVTGGGTGIGKAVALRLAKDNHQVVIVGRRGDVLDHTAGWINETLGESRVSTFAADCAEPAAVRDLARHLEAGAPIDVLVTNAGGTTRSTGDDLEAIARDWIADYTLNVVTAVLVTEALLPLMSRPDGRIVAMSSVAGLRGAGSYGAAKAAMNSWVTGLAADLAPEGITVNALAPGFVPDTDFWAARRTDDLVQQRTARIPMGRPGTPAEVADAVAYFASERAGFTTGQVLGVHGGSGLARL
ncbi:MAG: SDR family NAD(P)-dependent oxidoreductase [Nocardioidaceae bacterium]